MATLTASPRGWEQSSEDESDDEALPASAQRGGAAGNRELPSFFILEIVKKTRGIGRAKLYMLNKENQIVKDLIEIDNRIMKHLVEIDNRKEIVKA